MQVFVVLLRFFGDDGKEKRLLPSGWLAGAIKPSVGRLAWTTQRRHDHGGGIRGERISEGHGQILPQKKKYAMQKINLDKCPQCRQSTRMSNTNQLPMTALGTIPSDRAKTFYRVESWNTGSFIADFATKAEAQAFAISDAHANGCRYDHKVSTCILKGA
jgi:hypothetical protein